MVRKKFVPFAVVLSVSWLGMPYEYLNRFNGKNQITIFP